MSELQISIDDELPPSALDKPEGQSGGEVDVDEDEMYGTVVRFVRSAFDPPEQQPARTWWDYFPEFVKTVERLQGQSQIDSDEAEALVETYLSRMVEATVNEQFRTILAGSLEGVTDQLWSEVPHRSASLYSVWSEELLSSE